MRIIGIDYGEVRTGIALSDLLGIKAQGFETIEHKNNEKKLLNRLSDIIKKYEVKKIVIGYPINMNATKGARVERTDKLIQKLEALFGLEVVKVDERLTTVAAQKILTELAKTPKTKKKLVDTISAEYILQMYLDKENIRKEKKYE